jgi:hypothetical protein
MIPVFERAETFHALDLAAPIIGQDSEVQTLISIIIGRLRGLIRKILKKKNKEARGSRKLNKVGVQRVYTRVSLHSEYSQLSAGSVGY